MVRRRAILGLAFGAIRDDDFNRSQRSACDLVHTGWRARHAAEPRHWSMQEVIEEMLRRVESVNPSTTWTDDVFFSTGPDVLNAVYARRRQRLRGKVTVLRMIEHGLRWQFGTYGTHLMVGAWA